MSHFKYIYIYFLGGENHSLRWSCAPAVTSLAKALTLYNILSYDVCWTIAICIIFTWIY